MLLAIRNQSSAKIARTTMPAYRNKKPSSPPDAGGAGLGCAGLVGSMAGACAVAVGSIVFVGTGVSVGGTAVAVAGRSVAVGSGVSVGAGVSVGSSVSVGSGVSVGTGVSVTIGVAVAGTGVGAGGASTIKQASSQKEIFFLVGNSGCPLV